MPEFLSVRRMHNDTGLHRDTVEDRLHRLVDAGLIMVFGEPTGRGFRLDAIMLSPPRHCFPEKVYLYRSRSVACFAAPGLVDVYDQMREGTVDEEIYWHVMDNLRSQLAGWLAPPKPKPEPEEDDE